ncbi:MAG: hypothetical protein LBK99_10760 [Opitutaceae bacterium]|jgi:CRISPR-associated protein Csx17|nr:hypothetical protein [Opitutaceae bacterium]
MTTSPSGKLQVISLSGLHLDTLGHYFAALGLLRLAARQWPTIKGCWRDGVFHLVGGPKDFSELEIFLIDVGANNKWTHYTVNRPENAQTDSLEKKTDDLALWLAKDTTENEATLALSHIVAGKSRAFNPVFGTAGNAGNRSFFDGWEKACAAVKAVTPKAKKKKKESRSGRNAICNSVRNAIRLQARPPYFSHRRQLFIALGLRRGLLVQRRQQEI